MDYKGTNLGLFLDDKIIFLGIKWDSIGNKIRLIWESNPDPAPQQIDWLSILIKDMMEITDIFFTGFFQKN